jgi:hypothetical protein
MEKWKTFVRVYLWGDFLMTVKEKKDRFEFIFKDIGEATAFRNKLIDWGFYSNMSGNDDYRLYVCKSEIVDSFRRTFMGFVIEEEIFK